MLTRSFLAKSAKELGVDAKHITEGAIERLTAFGYPGNVRQLENICHWLTVMAPAQVIEAKDLPPELLAGGAPLASPAAAVPAVPTAPPEAVAVTSAGVPPSPPIVVPAPAVAAPEACGGTGWLGDLERAARELLEAGRTDVWDELTRQFEARLILTALDSTRGRRIEAAHKLGIGRNTITRKIQELGLE
jgi:two-component system nitrogen regulation response regulator GlnG